MSSQSNTNYQGILHNDFRNDFQALAITKTMTDLRQTLRKIHNDMYSGNFSC